jgi:hypothetical protein
MIANIEPVSVSDLELQETNQAPACLSDVNRESLSAVRCAIIVHAGRFSVRCYKGNTDDSKIFEQNMAA